MSWYHLSFFLGREGALPLLEYLSPTPFLDNFFKILFIQVEKKIRGLFLILRLDVRLAKENLEMFILQEKRNFVNTYLYVS